MRPLAQAVPQAPAAVCFRGSDRDACDICLARRLEACIGAQQAPTSAQLAQVLAQLAAPRGRLCADSSNQAVCLKLLQCRPANSKLCEPFTLTCLHTLSTDAPQISAAPVLGAHTCTAGSQPT